MTEVCYDRCAELQSLYNKSNNKGGGVTKVGGTSKKVEERSLKWCEHMIIREEHCIGMRTMERRKRKRGRWLDRVRRLPS